MNNRQAIKYLCDDLNIKKIKIKLDSPYLMGYLNTKKRIIHIKKDLSPRDFIFTLAHEARHLYQLDNNLINGYQENSELKK